MTRCEPTPGLTPDPRPPPLTIDPETPERVAPGLGAVQLAQNVDGDETAGRRGVCSVTCGMPLQRGESGSAWISGVKPGWLFFFGFVFVFSPPAWTPQISLCFPRPRRPLREPQSPAAAPSPFPEDAQRRRTPRVFRAENGNGNIKTV